MADVSRGRAMVVGGGTAMGQSSVEQVSQADIDAAMTTPTTLTFWTWVPNIEKEVALFEAAYPAIDVKVENVGQGRLTTPSCERPCRRARAPLT